MSTSNEQGPPRTISGTAIVAAVFTFALVLTTVMWLYWKLHTAPFLPLQQAVADTFPDSAPLVQGGQLKMHKNTPRILRITLRVNFDPNNDDQQVSRITNRVVALAREHQDLSEYDQLEINLFQLVPEHASKKRMVTFDAADLLKL